MSLSEKIGNFIRFNVAKRKLDSRNIDISEGNPLEQWGLMKIRSEVNSHDELKRQLPGKELDRNDIVEYKLFKLRELIDYVSRNSPFYQELYEKEGISSADIKTIDDLDRIPLTEQEELAKNPYHFLCVSRKDIAREFTTSGTTTTDEQDMKKEYPTPSRNSWKS